MFKRICDPYELSSTFNCYFVVAVGTVLERIIERTNLIKTHRMAINRLGNRTGKKKHTCEARRQTGRHFVGACVNMVC